MSKDEIYQRVPEGGELPGNCDKIISVTDLERDKFNVRNVRPDDELVSSIKKTGFKFPVTVRPHPEKNGGYLVTDGWQRYQSAVKAGYTHIPCDIYSKLEAFREAERSSIQNPWTNYQRVKHNACWFGELVNDGYTEKEAMEHITENGSVAKKTLRKYIRIYDLPDDIHVLLKKVKNRSEDWNRRFLFRAANLDDSDGVLKIEIAKRIGKAYSDGNITKEEARSFAIQGVKHREPGIIEKAIEKVAKFSDVNVQEAVDEEAKRQKERGSEGISVGSIILHGEDKKYFDAYRRQSRMTTNKIVSNAVSEKIEEIKENDVLKEEYKPE